MESRQYNEIQGHMVSKDIPYKGHLVTLQALKYMCVRGGEKEPRDVSCLSRMTK